MLKSGKVTLGAVRNLESRARNFAGNSDENSRAYASVRQTLEKLRNNYLLLAKGVQTEGDAVRAWNSEIGEFVQNDNTLALQQLEKARAAVVRATAAQNRRIETVYRNFGAQPPAALGNGGGDGMERTAPAGDLVPGVSTAINKKTGERRVWTGEAGGWVPVK
jgi:hypothetical protein